MVNAGNRSCALEREKEAEVLFDLCIFDRADAFPLLPDQMQHDQPLVRTSAMLEEVDALPCA